MSRAKLMLDLIKSSDINFEPDEMLPLPQAAGDENVFTNNEKDSAAGFKNNKGSNEVFQENNLVLLYESAPNSVLISPKNLPSIQPPLSAPQLTDPENDLITLEDLGMFETVTVPTVSTVDDIISSPPASVGEKSPYSQISRVELFGSSNSSPGRDFSDSGSSWYPDSEPDRFSKKKSRVCPEISFSDSSEDCIPVERKKRQRKEPITIPPSDESTTTVTHYSPSPAVESASTDFQVSSTLSICNLNDHINSPSTSTSITTVSPKRWKKSDPAKWKKNIVRANRNNCLPYQGKKGKNMPAKAPKPVKCLTTGCRFQCSLFSWDDRKLLCEFYWKINDYTSKKQYLVNNVVPMPIKRMAVTTRNDKHRIATNAYYFSKNGEKIRVCKDFFLKTLCISNGPVIKALSSINELGHFVAKDKRGSGVPVNKTSPEIEQRIIDHINTFPRMESHYCRKKSKRQYLDSKLSIAKMFELYMDELKSTGEKPASLFVYKRIFGTKFNLSFFKPKKDLCLTCSRYNNTGQPLHLTEEYEQHIARKTAAQQAKEADKQKSIDDPCYLYLVVTVDMQSTLQIPVSGEGVLYYSRKLNVQNFTIHVAKPPNEAYCIVWNEINGKRGSAEIATALNWWISQIPPTIKELTIYSDTCAGQNRNQYVTAFLIYTIQRTNLQLQVIEQKFLESGHTHMEVDSMHSAIENEARHTPVYSMIDWKSIMLRARSKRHRETAPPYIVHELTYEDMIDVRTINELFVKNVSRDMDGQKVMWLKIKCLRVEREKPGIVMFRYSHDGPYSLFDIFENAEGSVPRTRTRKRGQENVEQTEGRREDLVRRLRAYELPKAYESPIPISDAKKKDLLNLCVKGVIPRELHPWFQSLTSKKDIVDRLGEPDVTECDEDGNE